MEEALMNLSFLIVHWYKNAQNLISLDIDINNVYVKLQPIAEAVSA